VALVEAAALLVVLALTQYLAQLPQMEAELVVRLFPVMT
jgi:hypothetical protein